MRGRHPDSRVWVGEGATDGPAERHIPRDLQGRQEERQGRQEGMLSLLLTWRWMAERKTRKDARHQAIRHLAVVARALYTGDTSSYHLVPDLPRHPDSTTIGWHADHD